MLEAEIRRSQKGALVTLGVGLGLAVAVATIEFLQAPYVVLVVSVAILVGFSALIDRRVKLAISEVGLRYSAWGPAVVPWHEFYGFRWTRWRGQPYLQLVPRRPGELVAGFSAIGKLNHFLGGLGRMPEFSIAANQLEASDSKLTELIGGHLPHQPLAAESRS